MTISANEKQVQLVYFSKGAYPRYFVVLIIRWFSLIYLIVLPPDETIKRQGGGVVWNTASTTRARLVPNIGWERLLSKVTVDRKRVRR